jgi:hypothetical protein
VVHGNIFEKRLLDIDALCPFWGHLPVLEKEEQISDHRYHQQ